jgi:2-polyprenyl-3-methyl-5-hydroxy-6-metoxy-1,4-benzoquinol methylase
MDEDVLKLMTPEFSEKLSAWLLDFESFRKDSIQKLDYNNLPKSGIAVDKHIWKARTQDLDIILALVDGNCKHVLEIGSWNGWLANNLSKKGLKVTAIDYFTDELDGMKAKKFYQNSDWNSIQMDLEDLSVLDSQFDLIIMNRCLPYFTDLDKLIDSCYKLLSSNGQLIITGINVSDKKSQGETKELKQAKIDFKKKYDQEVFFKPTKGYIDDKDLKQLQLKNVNLFLYPNVKNLIKQKWLGKGNVTYYGIYKNK